MFPRHLLSTCLIGLSLTASTHALALAPRQKAANPPPAPSPAPSPAPATTPARSVDALAMAEVGQVERLDILGRKTAFDGKAFGKVGTYDLLWGVAHMLVAARHPANQTIADLNLAPADAQGWVRYKTNVVLLRPTKATGASGVLVVDLPNRGNKLAVQWANGGHSQFDAAADAGTGYLMAQGHTLAWVGWQGNVALDGTGKSLGTEFPLLAAKPGKNAQEAPLLGETVEEAIFDSYDAKLKMSLTYPASSLDPQFARLTVRQFPGDKEREVPAEKWSFVNERELSIQRDEAFDAGAIYQFTYVARDAKPMGLGLAAVRDVTAFLRWSSQDSVGQANPLGDIRPNLGLLMGVSQSGRFLRDYLWHGFNALPGAGKVFDGAMPLIAGSRKSFTNVRWAQPGRYSRQQEDHFFYGDQFPFSYAVTEDPVTRRVDGIFARCEVDQTCPKLMHVDSSLEFWQGRASLVVTDGVGSDIALPDNVRAYLMASTQHAPSTKPDKGLCDNLNNPAPQGPTVRALMDALVAWTRDGKAPPDSRFPSLRDDTLAVPRPADVGFPDLSAMGMKLPRTPNALTVVDYDGAPTGQPNNLLRYRVFVPKVDAVGNDLGGVRGTDVEVPLATYTGWNLRKMGWAGGMLCGLNGSYLPLSADAQRASELKDPRPTIASLYPRRTAYVQAVARAAKKLQGEGLLRADDAIRAIEAAGREERVRR